MTEIKIKIKRVFKGDSVGKPIKGGDFTRGVIPSDGYILDAILPGTVSIYVRDEDIESAKTISDERKRSTTIIAKSWGGEVCQEKKVG